LKVKEVPHATMQKSDDILVRITTTTVRGSDIHLYNREIPNTPEDFIIGHERMGIIEEVGKDVTKVKKGDRVIQISI
jgi:S-(hydroxymethyl)glutathione dehydrogenase/alcohol dehydrogenase